MSGLSFDEAKVFEDTANDVDIIKSFIETEHEFTQEPFYILDIDDVIQKHQNWIAKMPRVVPHYAVKCNPDPTFIKILAAMNASFDCASAQEIRAVMKHGVHEDRIIFANTNKLPVHIKFAKKMNVRRMTADSEMEILKIKKIFPEARIVIRIRCDAKNTTISLGSKFGCEPDDEAVRLIHLTKSLGLTLWGFSFHVGTQCIDLNAYDRGIKICKRLMAVARTIGCDDVQLIDIGGGFFGEKEYSLNNVANIVNDAIRDLDPHIEIISEPGRYYATSAFSLASLVHTKRIVPRGGKMIRMYYINCGVYNSFIEELISVGPKRPIPLHEPVSDEKFVSFIWGPTCDSRDCVVKDALLPEYHAEDWLIWTDMGAYTISTSTTFNGFSPPKVHPFVRKSEWEKFAAYRETIQKPQQLISLCNREENVDH